LEVIWPSVCCCMMSGMNKALRLTPAFAGLTLFLASCGSGFAPDGSVVTVDKLRTEYQTTAGTFVACDNVADGTKPVTNVTNVAVSFSLIGSISTVEIGLRGVTSNQFDGNYNATVQASQLSNLGGNSFKTVFKANAVDGQYLPQSIRPLGIIVNPAAVTIKVVDASNQQNLNGPGSFYAAVKIVTSSGDTATGNTRFTSTIPVFAQCNVIRDTGEKL
jgi:hypothetical protein